MGFREHIKILEQALTDDKKRMDLVKKNPFNGTHAKYKTTIEFDKSKVIKVVIESITLIE